jgi:hypothetical protein
MLQFLPLRRRCDSRACAREANAGIQAAQQAL